MGQYAVSGKIVLFQLAVAVVPYNEFNHHNMLKSRIAFWLGMIEKNILYRKKSFCYKRTFEMFFYVIYLGFLLWLINDHCYHSPPQHFVYSLERFRGQQERHGGWANKMRKCENLRR